MNITEVARLTGLTPRMIRHYESIGLVPEPSRTGGNYRNYGDEDVERLRLVASARDAGFGLDDIRDLLDLWSGAAVSHREDVARRWLELISVRERALRQVRALLSRMVG